MLCCLATLVALALADACDLRVAPDGVDANSSAAFATLYFALQRLPTAVDVTVCFAPGSYNATAFHYEANQRQFGTLVLQGESASNRSIGSRTRRAAPKR
jgi:hypothetical protein